MGLSRAGRAGAFRVRGTWVSLSHESGRRAGESRWLAHGPIRTDRIGKAAGPRGPRAARAAPRRLARPGIGAWTPARRPAGRHGAGAPGVARTDPGPSRCHRRLAGPR